MPSARNLRRTSSAETMADRTGDILRVTCPDCQLVDQVPGVRYGTSSSNAENLSEWKERLQYENRFGYLSLPSALRFRLYWRCSHLGHFPQEQVILEAPDFAPFLRAHSDFSLLFSPTLSSHLADCRLALLISVGQGIVVVSVGRRSRVRNSCSRRNRTADDGPI